MRCLLSLSLCALFAVSFAPADGLVRQLPVDGTYAKYEIYAVTAGLAMEGHLTLASVGKVEEDGQPCRWIEMKVVLVEEREDKSVNDLIIVKALFPEKRLKAGENQG